MNKDGVLEERCGYLGPKQDENTRTFRGAQSIQ